MRPGDGFRRRVERSRPARSPRVNVDVFCSLGKASGRALGRIRDFTKDGCRIHTPRRVKVGETLPLHIQLPGFSQEFNFKVEVRWIDFAGKGNLYEIGARFVHTAKTQKILKDLLWELHSGNIPEMERKSGERSTQRFTKP